MNVLRKELEVTASRFKQRLKYGPRIAKDRAPGSFAKNLTADTLAGLWLHVHGSRALDEWDQHMPRLLPHVSLQVRSLLRRALSPADRTIPLFGDPS